MLGILGSGLIWRKHEEEHGNEVLCDGWSVPSVFTLDIKAILLTESVWIICYLIELPNQNTKAIEVEGTPATLVYIFNTNASISCEITQLIEFP